jgi:hypothetical protein
MVSFRVVVDKLKSTFLLKKFKQSVRSSEFIDDLHNIINVKESFFCSDDEIHFNMFDNIKNYICKQNVITEVKIILDNYYRWFKIDTSYMFRLTPKHLLSAWMINYCPSIILGDLDSDEKYYLNMFADRLINQLNLLYKSNKDFDIIEFNRTLILYSDSILLFLEKDKIDKINHYTAEWISLEKSYELINNSHKYEDEQKNIILTNIINDKILIEKNIKLFMKNFDFSRLKIIIDISKTITKKTIENYKLIIQKDILEKKYDISSKLLDDIKKFIVIFNRKDDNNISEINEKIDSHYFSNLLQNNILNINDIKLFGDYLIKKICQIGSLSCETESLIRWNNIKNDYVFNNQNNLLISDMLIFSLETIETIKNELLDYGFLLKNIYPLFSQEKSQKLKG